MAADSKVPKTIGGAKVITTIAHGSTASTARPSTALVPAGSVIWRGTVAPTNSVDGDIWIDET